ncbi:hypothetical protein PAXRUDRAFT_20744 [Paxillus rubicundulus Ve08.2h10]|uniref:Uncharacterized protein n=1 Tax=Paxillus rubicundulus Ve08.2h10 TaxID=930991 RepID=A0A0D0D138_9AGAM|nr:hypothetical protein PAXRUDRAFT_20744 [Paxillus rubicundulus Ve08.2h10]
MMVAKAVGTAKKHLTCKAKASGGRAPQMQLSDDDQPMTVDEDIEAMPQWSSSLPPMTPSPVQGSSALPPASADDAKNDSTLSTSFLQALIFNTFIEGATLPSSIPFSLKNSF